MPGNASGGMDGVAVKPLTVSFHETEFLVKLNQENGLGFWFQLDDEEKEQAGSALGPENPQSLNRYSYVLNNPLRYTDPTGHCPWCRALLPILRSIGQALSRFGQWLGNVFRPNPAVITGSSRVGAALVSNVKIATKSLQHAYTRGHAADFGITGNWNKANAALFEQAVRNHMSSSTTIITQGTYRGTQQVNHYYNPTTGLWAITDLQGNFIAAWRLSQAQVQHLLTSGNVQ